MIINMIGIIFIVVGVLFLYKSRLRQQFYKKLERGNVSEYQKIVGVVICDAYHISDASELIKPVTPIVEYEVNGEKYETQNSVLETGAELPVGTKVYVWYKKDNPKNAILGTEIKSYTFKRSIGFLLVAIGILIVFLNI